MAIENDTNNQHPKRTKEFPQITITTNLNPVSNPMQNLPHEIIVEILSRLPVKSLLRFRCVSKSWCSLISSTQFAKTHLDVSSRNKDYANCRLIFSSVRPHFDLKSCSLHCLLYEPSVNAIEMDYPMKNPHHAVWIVGSVNGLVCIAIEEDSIFLWNPSTRESKKLPNLGIKLKYGCYIIYGFGYDEISDDYKVVGIFCVFGIGGLYETEVKVYSLRTDSWRGIGEFPGGIPLDDSGKFTNGALHWASSRDMRMDYWVLVSLDLAKETFGEVAQPKYGDGDFSLTLGVLGGCLCVLCDYRGIHANVWLMKEYGKRETWTKIATIPYLQDPVIYTIPLCISKNDELLLELRSYLRLYNPKDDTFKYPRIRNFGTCFEANTYVESLISFNIDDAAEGQQQ
ncbi:unnamed protein product [Ilex paraguariensis]|uniref:F-box domain-containing protein n=1 Tax=Ilex paraguariensis TaxID=185542 RepID=A0ABC8U2G3_9AQUA